jgi:pyruvyl transferase EpsO
LADPLIAKLAGKVLSALAKVVPPGPYALLDFPDHSNVGDSAIWLGERAILGRHHGCKPAYVCAYHDFDHIELENALPEGAIYLHGGGNFGDLYPKHQLFRKEIMGRYGQRVVQLPQSLYFGTRAAKEEAKRLPSSGATLMVRDQPSATLARELGFDPIMVPDCAFGMGPLARIGRARVDLLVLKRTDAESVQGGAAEVDWLEESPRTRQIARLWTIATKGRLDRLGFYDRLAKMRVRRGVRLLSQGRRIATDRLHAHILSLMLGIPHYAADNLTGKVHAFVDCWTGESPLVTEVRSFAEIPA